jgi:menaquinone-specific isochorismate synthase
VNELAELGAGGFAWLRPDGTGFVTSGVAHSLDPRDMDELAGRFGDTAIAVGALPFRGDDMLAVPARVATLGRDGRTARFEFGTPRTWIEPPRPPSAMHHVPRRFTIEARQDLSSWDAAVAAALGAIESGALEKVVLAREVAIEADTPFALGAIVERLRATQPGCFVYAHGGFAGASPELLVRRCGTTVTSRPMAGTVARLDDPAADDAAIAGLCASRKDDVEHRLVVDAVREVLAPLCDALRVGEPEARRFTTVTHLTTAIEGRLRDADTTAADLALRLHPTPAVGGAPRAAALELIERLEPFDRGRYGGPVGWIGAHGDGEFAVALRCAQIDGARARLLAGAGIVAGSDPDAEWIETQAKLEPMLRVLVRP